MYYRVTIKKSTPSDSIPYEKSICGSLFIIDVYIEKIAKM